MNARRFAMFIDRTCSGLFLGGFFPFFARALRVVLWPWWCVLTPWLVVAAIIVLTLLYILGSAAAGEWRCARQRRRCEPWNFARRPPRPWPFSRHV